MRHIQVDYKSHTKPRHARRPTAAGQQQRHGKRSSSRPKSPRCPSHPGVHMVLAGYNTAWNTVRYLCPMCNAMGRPPIEVATGVVNVYFPNKGYGFIENGGPRIFFHISDLVGSRIPYVGMPVTCQVEENDKGLIGREVQQRREAHR